MRNKTIFLLFFIIEILIVLVILIDCLNLTEPSRKEGAQGAYYTDVKYPSLIHQGEKTSLTLTIYNKECSADDTNASFFFIFYVDGDLWLNEFNTTDYGTWQCKKGSSVTRYYMVTGWDDMKPVVHNLRSELYWRIGNESILQDVTTVPITVAFFAETTNLMVYSYMTLYLIAIFLLGFYITLSERIAIPSSPPKKVNIIEQPHAKKDPLSKLHRKSFLNFYLFVFVSWQGINILFYILSVPIKILSYASLMAQICYLAILVLLIKRNGLNFAELGYVWPETSHKHVSCSLFFGVFYSFITIFLPGFFTGYEVFPSPSAANILNAIFFAIIFSFISESIFRGYIQTSLGNLIGFPHALFATSVMYALYMASFVPFNQFYVAYEILSFFMAGIFLGILFYKTKTLLSSMFFYTTLMTFKTLMPIKAIALDSAKLFAEFVALALTLILLHVFVAEKEASKIYLSENIENYFGEA